MIPYLTLPRYLTYYYTLGRYLGIYRDVYLSFDRSIDPISILSCLVPTNMSLFIYVCVYLCIYVEIVHGCLVCMYLSEFSYSTVSWNRIGGNVSLLILT